MLSNRAEWSVLYSLAETFLLTANCYEAVSFRKVAFAKLAPRKLRGFQERTEVLVRTTGSFAYA
jgi:hypothetical protein